MEIRKDPKHEVVMIPNWAVVQSVTRYEEKRRKKGRIREWLKKVLSR